MRWTSLIGLPGRTIRALLRGAVFAAALISRPTANTREDPTEAALGSKSRHPTVPASAVGARFETLLEFT